MRRLFIILIALLCGCSKNEQLPTSLITPLETKDVILRVTIQSGELSNEQIKEFEAANPGIKVEITQVEELRLKTMLATGNAPDIIRLKGATQLATYAANGYALNLQKRIEQSTVINNEDFLPIVDLFKWNGVKNGEGELYGLPKDWSLDHMFFINKSIFNDRGVPVPNPKIPMTYEQFLDISSRLYKEDGGRVVTYGSCGWELLLGISNTETYLTQQGKSLWSDDMRKININNEDVIEIFNYINANVQSKSLVSPINPADAEYPELFCDGKVGMFQAGYWMSGELRSNTKTKNSLDNFMMLPAIQMKNGIRVSPCTSAVGAIIFSETENPNEAFKFFEYFFGGKPADTRAKSGWGIPIYESKLALLPRETDFDKQCYEVLMDEIENSARVFVQTSPYLNMEEAGTLIRNLIPPVYFRGGANVGEVLEELEMQIQEMIDSNAD